MFKLIALVIVTLNGQMVGEPLKAVHRISFETQALCEAYQNSEENTVALAKLDALIIPRLPAGAVHTVTTKCEPDDSV